MKAKQTDGEKAFVKLFAKPGNSHAVDITVGSMRACQQWPIKIYPCMCKKLVNGDYWMSATLAISISEYKEWKILDVTAAVFYFLKKPNLHGKLDAGVNNSCGHSDTGHPLAFLS